MLPELAGEGRQQVQDDGTVLGLVGSPNREGRTFQMVLTALEGAAKAGAQVELVQLADHRVAACKDCEPSTCAETLKCAYSDEGFEHLSGKLLACGALVLGTPIYWWDTTAMVRLLMLKMFRVFARSGPLAGLPAVGIGVAGGTGNGLVSGLRPVYHFFQMLQMRALDPIPVTRFNWDWALSQARQQGAVLASMAGERHPFTCLEERLLWYDDLPYLSMSRAAERRLLAALTTAAASDDAPVQIAGLLARAEALAAAGEDLESLKVTTSIYEASVKAFESQG
jgi:multimeric flavodoxin WrbA